MNTTLSSKTNPKFDIKGLNHLALVCKDMQKTVDFYQGILGMPLIKTCDLPYGMGQHFFFDMGGGASLAFFWFPDAPEVESGITVTQTLMGLMGNITTAVGSMNHVAFAVDVDRLEEYKARLEKSGVEVSPIMFHDDSPIGHDFGKKHPSLWATSIYFKDPDGMQLEFCAFNRKMSDADVVHTPATSADKNMYLAKQPK